MNCKGRGAAVALLALGVATAHAQRTKPVEDVRAEAVRQAHRFAGANAGAKIAACIADLPASGGVCDAGGFEGTQVISSPLVVGDGKRRVELRLPFGAQLEVAVATGGDAIRIGDGSAIVAMPSYGMATTSPPRIKLAPGARVNSLIAPFDRSGAQNSMSVIGVRLQGDPGARMSGALLDVQGVFAGSVFRDISTANSYGRVLWIRPGNGKLKITSDLTFINCDFNGGSVPGAVPLVIESSPGGGVGNITFVGGAVQHPANGLPVFDLNAESYPTYGIAGVFFFGVHFEGPGPPAKAGAGRIRDASNVLISGFSISGGWGRDVFLIEESAPNRTQNIRINSGYNSTSAERWVNNSAADGISLEAGIHLGEYTFRHPRVGFGISRRLTIDFGRVASGTCASQGSYPVSGAALGDVAAVTASSALAEGTYIVGTVSAPNTVNVLYCNFSGASVDRAPESYTVRVFR